MTRVGAGAAAFVAGLLLVACGSSSPDAARESSQPSTSTPEASSTTVPASTTSPPPVIAPNFDATDAALDARVASAGLSGGMVRVAASDGTVLDEHAVGDVSGSTPLAVASSAKWLTAATFMTFVDQGLAALDDDVARWLPEFAGSNPPMTVRQLLTHTSGVRDHACQSNGASLATCVQQLATSAREFPAGTQFSYGNAPFLMVGRVIEVLGGADFATVVQQRITGPLEMMATTWPGAPGAPNPAYGLRVTVDDDGRFLDMILNRGVANGTRVLSAAAVEQLVVNQMANHDTNHDYSVGITGIPRYALGAWVDVEAAPSQTTVVSGNGGMGFYPWVDYPTGTWGIVGVQDERGAEVAVPASQDVSVEARRAIAG